MKRSLLFALAIALLGACATKEIDFQTPVQDDVVFYASFEQPSDIDTRVYANEDLLLRWTAEDRVSIFNKLTYNQEYKFTGQTGANAGGFKKVDNDEFVTGNPISHVVSVYPYQEATTITEEEVINLTLPAEQAFAENTFGLGANTMVSVSEDNVLQYKNVGGYLMLKLYGEGVSVSSITLKGNNGEKLAGKASVTMPLDGVPTVTMNSDATDVIALTCPEPVQLGATEEESTQFWFVVPPMTFEKGFTITVKDDKNGVFEKSTTKSFEISRNKLAKMSAIEVSPEPSDDAIAFADQKLKERLVAKFDTNGDGEISYKEAAAVTSIEGAVTIKTITSFDEFQYFTGVTTIPDACFQYWEKLSSISLPSSITSIGASAFANCSELEFLQIPNEVKAINIYTFAGCSKLKTIILPKQLSVIGQDAFSGCTSLQRISIPETVYSISYSAFNGCSSLTSITIPSAIKVLSEGIFAGCSSLIEVNLPSELWTIQQGAFHSCTSLATITLPPSLQSIGTRAFMNCTQLTTIIIPDNVGNISEFAFSGCMSLRSVKLPSSLKTVSGGAFYQCSSLQELVIPNGIEIVDGAYFNGKYYGAFEECTSLRTVYFPETITKIGKSAFANCSSIIEISLPESLVSIERLGFYNCTGLKSLAIPASVQWINDYAFYGCTGLTQITVLRETPPTGSQGMFSNTNDAPICVPAGSVEAYKTTQFWSDYAERIRAIPEAIDLGLSVKWASFNLGASKPEEYGDYYAWGETEPKDDYSWSSYKWCMGSENTMTKYCSKSEYGYNGFTDTKTVLDLEDDAAHIHWGDKWRMPTSVEWRELQQNCTLVRTTVNDVEGMTVTSKVNGQSIFIPYTDYWASTMLSSYSSQYGDYANCNDGGKPYINPNNGELRFRGLSIRPVYAE